MNQLLEIRKQLKLTQTEAAALCNVSRRTFQTYEETNNCNEAYQELINKLNALGIFSNENVVLSKKRIKKEAAEVFKKYPEIRCAYLFGSYARGEATGKSDIDFLLVLSKPMGITFFGIAADLENKLHKEIDITVQDALMKNKDLLDDVLSEGIKVYG